MRIAGITLPNKRVGYALTAIYGIGLSRSQKILTEAKIDFNKKSDDLTEKEENSIRRLVESYKIEGDLKREKSANIKRLKDIKCYRGMRHQRGLPSRGQRTKTNARTLRGKRKTMGSGKRKVEKK